MSSPLARAIAAALALVVLAGSAAALSARQQEPLTAGGEGVPVPKKVKHVQPVYPPEALAQGIRGIVILDIVVDAQGKVSATNVLRSVPGLDEAAIAAARQWEYEPSKVDGKPVSVRLTVPITFSLALPRLQRQAGVPELRQGVTPVFPPDAEKGGSAVAELTLEPDGRIASANLLSGEAPWSQALLAALKTWRFAPPADDAVVSFRVEVDFVKARGGEPNAVQLRATGLQRSELLADAPAASAPAPASQPPPSAPAAPLTGAPPAAAHAAPAREPSPAAAAPAPAAPAPSAPAATTPAPATTPPGAPALAKPAAAQPAAPPAVPAPAPPPAAAAPAPPTTRTPPVAPPGAPKAAPTPATTLPAPEAPPGASSASAAPTVEVITAQPPAPLPESGVSAVRDVTLEAGVPELSRGRRPVPPPLARLSATTGTVEVAFSVSAGGVTALQTATGPDLLRYAAEQTVATWVFRRTRADRAYLVAVFTFGADKASAVVRPQPAPAAAPSAPAAAAPPPPSL